MNPNARSSSSMRLPLSVAVLASVIHLGVATPLRAQSDLERVLSSFPQNDAARLEAFILQPRWEGFPTELLIAKIAEGAAKRVEAGILLAALSDYAGRLAEARVILGDRASVTTLEATADVLARDVPVEVVRSVASVNPREAQLTASMVALGDLAAAGVPPDQAEALLLDAATQRRGNEDVLQIPALVRRWIRQGFQPADAAAEVKRSMDLPGQPNDGLLDRYMRPPRPEPPF